jgi:hypothetical protein
VDELREIELEKMSDAEARQLLENIQKRIIWI